MGEHGIVRAAISEELMKTLQKLVIVFVGFILPVILFV